MTDFEKIYAENFRAVYKYALVLSKNRSLAEEITQEAFFKALQKIDTFRGESSLRVWLCQIAKNIYYSLLRERKKLILSDCEEASERDIESALLDSETAFAIHKALHSIKEPYKEVFSLRLFGELSFLQIGELFEKSESWARVTYHRAKIMVKEKIR
ncbi:MAG: sigma-70 family RNA polymerase sigma factor [Candidatus Pelethousia sp.]|nr:sigma-70 family RNA polymerase sigma factor [Candidatus Pelethousia sp.]